MSPGLAIGVRFPLGALKKKSAPKILLEKEGRKSKLHQVFHSKTSAAIGQLAKSAGRQAAAAAAAAAQGEA